VSNEGIISVNFYEEQAMSLIGIRECKRKRGWAAVRNCSTAVNDSVAEVVNKTFPVYTFFHAAGQVESLLRQTLCSRTLILDDIP